MGDIQYVAMPYKSFLVLLACLVTGWSGEMEFGKNTKMAEEFQNKKFNTRNLSPGSLGSGTSSEWDKSFATKKFTGFDREANIGGKEITAPILDYNKTYPTATSPLGQKKSSLGDTPASIQLTESSWSSRPSPQGWDKKLPTKVYTGREAEKVNRSFSEVTRSMNPGRAIPDRALNEQEVKALLNRDVGPEPRRASASEASAPTQR
jgi:hypothetical protein